MSYWKYAGKINPAPSFAAYVRGETVSWSMTFVNDEAPRIKAYLFIPDEWLGCVRAKLHTDSEYMEMGLVGDPACFLGEIPLGETVIDFQFCNIRTDVKGYQAYTIPVGLAWDLLGEAPMGPFHTVSILLWESCYDSILFWQKEYRQTRPVCQGIDPKEWPYESGLSVWEPSWASFWQS